MKKQLIGVGLLALTVIGVGSGCTPQQIAAATRKPTVAKPHRCPSVSVDGLEIVTFGSAERITCDVQPDQQLNLRYDEHSAPEWGGDASLEWADLDCANHGGRAIWLHDVTMNCVAVDF
jgi:hypothetical protein